jgi:hypothetical protein
MPGWSSYKFCFNNPILYIDPDGRQEFESYGDYKKHAQENNLKVLKASEIGSQGHWLASDRENKTAVWDKANSVNLQKSGGHSEYKTITQRTAFYGWFAGKTDQKGYETNWPGAAYIVAGQMSNLDNSVVAWWVGEDAVKFGNDGNKAIFDDVFAKLKDLYNGPVLKGQAALDWDNSTLHNEQFNVVQPIYDRQSGATVSILNNMAKGKYLYGLGVTGPLRFQGNILNAQDRFNHGAGKVTNFYKLQKTYWKLGW